MKRRMMGILLAAVGLALGAWGFDGEYTAAQSATISAAGSYLVTGTGGGTLTVAADVTGVELTYSNAIYSCGTAQALTLNAGSSVTLTLVGTSSIACTTACAIYLPETAALTVDGTGSLTVTANGAGGVISGGNARMGALTLNGGLLDATCGGSGLFGLSAAIGGRYEFNAQAGHGGTVVVNGGELRATSFSGGPAIGGGCTYNTNGAGIAGDGGSLTVNGGRVVARSYSTLGAYCSGQRVPAIGGGGSRNAGGKWGRAAKIVVTGGELEAWVDHADATCFGNVAGPGTAQTNADDAGLTVTGGTVRWNHQRTDETGFPIVFSNCTVGCSGFVTDWKTGLWLPVATDLDTFFGTNVVFAKSADTTTPINSTDFALVDLAKGGVTLAASSPFTLIGSSASSGNTVAVTAGDTVEAAACNVISTGAWIVPDNSTITYYVFGANALAASSGTGYKLPATGTLVFRGTGYWHISSAASTLLSAIGMPAGAGDWGTLEVDGPQIVAQGSDRAAGVGGGYGFQSKGSGGGNVVVRAGKLTAQGYGGAPGIGGSAPYNQYVGAGPTVTVYTNGTLDASNMVGNRGGGNKMDPCGVAIGAGRVLMNATANYSASDAGTITVDGGTLYASAGNASASCFGCPGSNSNSAFTQKAGATGALTVKNGGKVFFNHATFPTGMTVTIDDGTLGTRDDTPAAGWVTFPSGLATVTNNLTIAGSVAPTFASWPSFLNNPTLTLDVGVTAATEMRADEWVEVTGTQALTAADGYCLNTKTENEVTLTRCDADDGWVRLSEQTGIYTITSNGVYRFVGKGAAAATGIKVNTGVICTNLFSDVTLTGTAAALELTSGAQVTLQLRGSSLLNRSQANCAVVRVPEGASLRIEDDPVADDTGALTIDQTGLAENCLHVVGIGEAGANLKSGDVTVDSGTITITMNHTGACHGGAAIGTACYGATFGSYTQNGGTVTLDGPALAPAIGGGTDNSVSGSGGTVTINGGVLTAKGYSGGSAIGVGPTYASGKVGRSGIYRQTGGTVYAYAYKTGGNYAAGQCGAAIGGAGTRNGTTSSPMGRIEISGGALYAYSDASYSIGCGKPQKCDVPARAATDVCQITGGTVYTPQGIQGTAVDDLGTMLGRVDFDLRVLTGETTTVDLGNDRTYVFPHVELFNNHAYAWLPSGIVTVDGRDYVHGFDAATPVVYDYTGARIAYVRGDTTLTTGGAARSGANEIYFLGSGTTTLSNFVYTATTNPYFGGTLALCGGFAVKQTFALVGTNRVQNTCDTAGIFLPDGAELTITGGADDWLSIDGTSGVKDGFVGIGVGHSSTTTSMGKFTLDSGNVDIRLTKGGSGFGGAAVGISCGDRTAGTVIVNGGTLYAEGGSIAAGIGGGYNNGGQAGHGGIVEVNGGVVTAKGYGGSAAIGGGVAYNGTPGKGGSFIQRGGRVYAYSYNAGGYATGSVGPAVGGGVSRDKQGKAAAMGTCIISNGTFTAYVDRGSAIGYGYPDKGSIATYTTSGGTFTIAGGSVKLASGNGAAVYNIAPSNGVAAVTCATIRGARLGGSPYDLTLTTKADASWSYRYTGTGHDDDANLYFYLPDGRYYANKSYFSFANGQVNFPGLIVILR